MSLNEQRLAGRSLPGRNLGINGAPEAAVPADIASRYKCILISDGVTPITRRELAHELQTERTESTSKIIELDEMVRLVAVYRQEGKSIVLTNGCFDFLHVGHLQLLEESARQGDVLIVAIVRPTGTKNVG